MKLKTVKKSKQPDYPGRREFVECLVKGSVAIAVGGSILTFAKDAKRFQPKLAGGIRAPRQEQIREIRLKGEMVAPHKPQIDRIDLDGDMVAPRKPQPIKNPPPPRLRGKMVAPHKPPPVKNPPPPRLGGKPVSPHKPPPIKPQLLLSKTEIAKIVKQVKELSLLLGAKSFRTRAEVTKKLIAIGSIPNQKDRLKNLKSPYNLVKTIIFPLQNSKDPEIAMRAKKVIKAISAKKIAMEKVQPQPHPPIGGVMVAPRQMIQPMIRR